MMIQTRSISEIVFGDFLKNYPELRLIYLNRYQDLLRGFAFTEDRKGIYSFIMEDIHHTDGKNMMDVLLALENEITELNKTSKWKNR